MLIFITGGVRSGKSSFAEMSAVYHAKHEKPLLYVATCDHRDREMADRIVRHQGDREKSGYTWRTWEQPRNVHKLSKYLKKNEVILLDCLTNLVSNELFAGWEENEERWRDPHFRSTVFRNIIDGIEALVRSSDTLIIVSNEVFQGLPSSHEGTFYFMEMMGKLHQRIVQQADWAYQVELGMPILRKGYDACEGQYTACPV